MFIIIMDYLRAFIDIFYLLVLCLLLIIVRKVVVEILTFRLVTLMRLMTLIEIFIRKFVYGFLLCYLTLFHSFVSLRLLLPTRSSCSSFSHLSEHSIARLIPIVTN